MAKKLFHDTVTSERTLLVGAQAPHQKTSTINAYYEEFAQLVKTLGIPYEGFIKVKLRVVDSSYFFTRGKLEEIKQECEKLEIEQIIVSDSLSPQQERNIEDFLGVSVIDRTQLILDIFEKAAESAEGKTQVAIAMLQHKKTRLAGKGIYLEQQKGGTGMRSGFGEKLKERDRRYINSQITKYKRQLADLQKVRETQRKRRLSSHVPQICLVGYTNAGKSTILNALTNSNVLAEDKLFATLDTTIRSLHIDGVQKAVISDTVGFIQQLPTHLIAAFKSTLSELQYADLLLQVVDLSDPNWELHIQVVNKILADLKLNKEMLYIFNKQDKVANLAELEPKLAQYTPHVIISAQSKQGIEPLVNFLRTWRAKPQDPVEHEQEQAAYEDLFADSDAE